MLLWQIEHGSTQAVAERDPDLYEDLVLWKVADSDIAKLIGTSGAPPEPELDAENAPYFRAFFDLSPSRATGFSVGTIPVTEVAAYWDRAGVDDFLTFLRRIRAADEAFLAWHREREKKRRT